MEERIKHKKKIFFLINSMYGGGAERVVANLVNFLSERYRVYLVLLNKKTPNDYKINSEVIVLDDGKKRDKIGQYIFYKKELERLSKEYKPDVIISFLLNACLCNMIANTSAKKILSIRNYLKKQFKGKKLYFWEICFRFIFNKADIIVSVSKLMEYDMKSNYKLDAKKSKVIYNPYYVEDIVRASKEDIENRYKSVFDGKVIINMGSLHKQKGQCHLIRVFAKLSKEFLDLKLVIIGKDTCDTGYDKKLKQLCKELGVKDKVIFLGHQTNPHKYLSKSTVFAFPSLYEGFPNALVESMICGLPIIACDCETGPREILSPHSDFRTKINEIEEAEYGILVPVDKREWIDKEENLTFEEEKLFVALKDILADQEKRNFYQEKSIIRAKEFSIKKIIDEWENIL